MKYKFITLLAAVLFTAGYSSAQDKMVSMGEELGHVRPEWGAQVDVNTNAPIPVLTFSDSVNRALTALSTGTNWVIGGFFTYVRDRNAEKNLWGGGVAALFKLSDNAGTMLRAEELDGTFYLITGNLQLQLPFDLLQGKIRCTPFGFVGGGDSFGSHAQGMVGIAGAGWDLKLPQFSKKFSVAFDCEYWSDRPGIQWRFAPLVYHFQ